MNPAATGHRLWALAIRSVFTSSSLARRHYQLLIAGGGSGGVGIAAKFGPKLGKGKVAVVEPHNKHFYQPYWTLVGGGLKKFKDSWKPTSSVINKNCEWIPERIKKFYPDQNLVVTSSGNEIKGLPEAFKTPGLCSNYHPVYVKKTFKCIQQLKSGNVIFTFPNTAIKCPGAPQKIMYMAEHYFRKYDMLHVAPPCSPPKSMEDCKELVDSTGYLDVDKFTLQHVRYPNVFGIGDCLNTPNSKTMASISKQLKVVRKNLISVMNNETPTAKYDGYSSCPIITDYGKGILAEFIYDCIPKETMPIDQRREMWLSYFLKREGMARIYWYLYVR
ncbi:unnamed protein product [Soboliphyme baturini]|uniref:Pyr_redox_2 domain-containing protein n=1 Tax=Soboliphyme baturini TaxID=241478 RepID=A0A183IAY2_9BILA|nr:unnamed protein product [Soboliphyme baturini]